MDTKTLADISSKWSTVTPQRASFYTAGVARVDFNKFQSNAAGAAANWASGLQQAIADNRFATKVGQSGAKWKQRVADVGGGRFSEGVSKGSAAYSTGFAPYLSVLQSMTLSPRGARGDPRNIQRVSDIATALHNQRRSGAAR